MLEFFLSRFSCIKAAFKHYLKLLRVKLKLSQLKTSPPPSSKVALQGYIKGILQSLNTYKSVHMLSLTNQ